MVNSDGQCDNINTSANQKTVIAFRRVFTIPIRGYFTPNSVAEYFKKFGAIESIELYTKHAHQFGSIEFKSSDAARRVLSYSIHHISPVAAFAVNLATEQNSKLLKTLNNDCLRKIFQYLNIKDLSKAADVCIRFNQLAVDAFVTDHRQDLVKIDLKNCWLNAKYFRKFDENEAIFRNFGALVKSLQIKNNIWINKQRILFGTIMLNAASEYITTGSLTELHLSGIEFNEEMTNIRSLFEHLEVLSLTNCNLHSYPGHFLNTCFKLKSLRINCCELSQGTIDYRFPKLEELDFRISEKLHYFHLNILIRLNPTLRKVKLEFDELYSVEFFDVLRQNLPNLMELDIKRSCHSFDFYHDQWKMARILSQLKTLKVLKLNYLSTVYFIASLCSKMVENNVAIEHLELCDECIADNIISSVAQFKQLKFVKFCKIYNLNDDDLVQLAQELPRLEQLHLENCWNITFDGIAQIVAHANKLSSLLFHPEYGMRLNKNNYQHLLQSIQNRPDQLPLTIETKSRSINVPRDVLLANQHWLHIPIKRNPKKLDLLLPFRNLTFKCV